MSINKESEKATCQRACCFCLMAWIYSLWEVQEFLRKYECYEFPPIQLVKCRTKSNDKRLMAKLFYDNTGICLDFTLHLDRN